ncbi:MAG: hypothetical protein K1X78_04115 [Verrucomicrobiaceae bacterium]|nr:hypothetical protein [Verrucomicrobiaceae bacterium]
MRPMQTLAKDESAEMSAPWAALITKLEDAAMKEWLVVLRGGKVVPGFSPHGVLLGRT